MTTNTKSLEIVYGKASTGKTFTVLLPLMHELARVGKPRTISPILRALMARQQTPEHVQWPVARNDVRDAVWLALCQSREGMSLSAPKSASHVIGVRAR